MYYAPEIRKANSKTRKKVIFLSVLLTLLTGAGLVLFLPSFHVRDIEVAGCKTVDPNQLIQISGIREGGHLFRNISGDILSLFSWRYSAVEKKVADHFPVIERVTIRAKFPGAVAVDVTERQKIAYVKVSDGFIVIDKEGIVMELTDGSPPDGVPLFSGIVVLSAVLSEKMEMEDERQLNTCVAVMSAILSADQDADQEGDFALAPSVRDIRFVDRDRFFLSLRLTEKDLVVKLSNVNTIDRDMRWLRYAIEQGSFADAQDAGILDMSGEQFTFKQT